MTNSIIDAQEAFLKKMNLVCKKAGINNIMAQLYAILYFSDKPLSLDDMVEHLRISKGSASVNIRALERYNAVKRVWVNSSRKDYYEAEPDIARIILQRVQAMAYDRISEIDDMLNSPYEILNSGISDKGEGGQAKEAFKEKLEKLKSLYDQAKSMFELFNTTFLNKKLEKDVTDEAKK